MSGLPRIRTRHLVLLMALAWAILISPYPLSLHGWGIVVTLVLIGLDVALGARTGWLAFARSSGLDEREAALRNRAYRTAFRVVIGGILLMALGAYLSSLRTFFLLDSPGPLPIPDPLGPRGIVALLELLALAPTAVIAWRQPDSERTSAAAWLGRAMPALAIPLVVGVWVLALSAPPALAVTRSQVPTTSLEVSGATCGAFSALREVGYGFGAGMRMRAAVCWDGKQAWIFGDPALREPAFVGNLFGPTPSDPYLTTCAVAVDAQDFAVVSGKRCTESIDANGTMHYVAQEQVSIGLRGLLQHQLRIDLVVTRDGRVINFG
ncbi:MAG TPA: hypothetical protein VET65_12750 [Candidatus Limnocylindrales bacterium]|nr:hypothetical protein [Candidatus Limnocylindrales bacterium]